MGTPPERISGFHFWLKWCLATAVGLGFAHASVSIPLPASIQAADFHNGFPLFWRFTFLHLFFGAGVGVAQWLLLRRIIPKAIWWIVAGVLSWTISWPIISWWSPNSYLMWWQGLLIGVAGLFVIRGRWYQNIILILAYGIGWYAAFYMATMMTGNVFATMNHTARFTDLHLPSKSFQDLFVWIAVGTCAGGVLGIITGWPIVWILRQKQQNAS